MASPNVLHAVREALLWSESRSGVQAPRSLFTVAFAPAGVLLGLVSALVLVALVSVNSDLTGAFGAIAVVWLAVHQVPFSVADTPLGALPLAPTAILIWFVARLSAQAVSTRSTAPQLRQVLASAVAGPLVITMILLATAKDAATVIPLNAPLPAPSLAWVTGVHLTGALIGVGWSWLQREAPPSGKTTEGARGGLAAPLSIPAWALIALRTGVRAGLWLFVLGGGLTVLGMVLHWGRLSTGFDPDAGVIGLFGVLFLSVLYLPNLMVGAVDVLLGATVHLGGTSMQLAQVSIGQLPCLPIFTALVPWHLGRPALVGLALPVLVGAWLGTRCAAGGASRLGGTAAGGVGAREALGVVATLRAVVSAAALASVLVVLVSATASGAVGVIGRWSVNAAFLGVTTFVLLVVPGVMTAVSSIVPAALQQRRVAEPVVVISPARDQPAWEESEREDESAEELDEKEGPGSDGAGDAETGSAEASPRTEADDRAE